MNPKRARARGMRADLRGIPRFEIEISPGSAWRFLAPGITALQRAIGLSIRGARELRFGRQFRPEPFRIRSGLRVAHVSWPLGRQTNLAKHRSVDPQIAFAHPEHRMLDAFLHLPGPGFVTPEGTVFVAPRLHEPQKIVIRYVVAVDGEIIHRHLMRANLVVPPKFIAINALQAQPCDSGRDFD